MSYREALFAGFLISLSSTAIVLKIYQEKQMINTVEGQVTLGILIFQDIIVVPLMLITSLMSGNSVNLPLALFILLLKTVLVISVVFFSSRYLIPQLLLRVAKVRNQSLFIITIIFICFSTAYLTSALGLSLALGAFLAGLMISDSRFSYQAVSNIMPFREIFTSFFFISIGLLINLPFLKEHFMWIILLTFMVLLLKSIITSISLYLLGYHPSVLLKSSLSLSQVGEFAFVLSLVGMKLHIISWEWYQYFLSVSILTMMLSPFIINISPKLSSRFMNSKIGERIGKSNNFKQMIEEEEDYFESLADHVIIIGYGLAGRTIGDVLFKEQVPYAVVELNAETVRKEQKRGIPIVYGDATNKYILEKVKLKRCRMVVIVISDYNSLKNIISCIRSISNDVYIIARTKYISENSQLYRAGCNEVHSEEFEVTLKLVSRVLTKYIVSIETINKYISHIQANAFSIFHKSSNATIEESVLRDYDLSQYEISIVRINQKSEYLNKKLGILTLGKIIGLMY